MKKSFRFSVALIYGCLAGISSGFSPRDRQQIILMNDGYTMSPRRSSSSRHPPFASRARAGPSFGSTKSSPALHASGDASLTSRRKWFSSSAASLLTIAVPFPAHAKKGEGVVGNPFDAIRYEVSDPKGGVAYLRSRIDANDFDSVLDFTKEYDLVLRKIAMGTAKKRLPKGPIQDKGTEICNAVTFDLIGINRNSRKGQENANEALRYLDELVQDAKRMIELEPYAESPPPAS